jgi:hypothetical protein
MSAFGTGRQWDERTIATILGISESKNTCCALKRPIEIIRALDLSVGDDTPERITPFERIHRGSGKVSRLASSQGELNLIFSGPSQLRAVETPGGTNFRLFQQPGSSFPDELF